jgi:hypothetical protein
MPAPTEFLTGFVDFAIYGMVVHFGGVPQSEKTSLIGP